MRSWAPIPATELDDKGLLGEHGELHVIGKELSKLATRESIARGWSHHPEVKRWIGHTIALRDRHDALVAEMTARGMNHNSPWPKGWWLSWDSDQIPPSYQTEEEMRRILAQKKLLRKGAMT
jgi:hypothetical protein